MTADPLRGKRVLVLGYGRQGRALTRWLPTLGARVVVSDQAAIQPAIDELPPGAAVEFVSGDHPLQLLDTTDLVCLSGGVPLTAPIVRAARERAIPLANDAQLFLERCPGASHRHHRQRRQDHHYLPGGGHAARGGPARLDGWQHRPRAA